MSNTSLLMNTLVLLNSSSPGYIEGYETVLPHLDHLGVPHTVLDLMHTPLPCNVADYALIVVAHRRLDPRGIRLGQAARQALLAGVRAGNGLVSFDPALPSLSGDEIIATLVEVPVFDGEAAVKYPTAGRRRATGSQSSCLRAS